MHASSWASPSMTTNESIPGRRGSEDFPQSLSKNGERPGRNMTVLLGSRHFLDSSKLLARQLMGESPWAGGDIIEFALLLASPGVISCRRETDDAKRPAKGQRGFRPIDCAKEARFFLSLGTRRRTSETSHTLSKTTTRRRTAGAWRFAYESRLAPCVARVPTSKRRRG